MAEEKQLLFPLLFWGKPKQKQTEMLKSVIEQINALGKDAFTETEKPLSLWDKKRLELRIPADCACCSEDVDKCYTDWCKDMDMDPVILEAKLATKNKGAIDIIKKHFRIIPDLTDDAITTLCEFMVFTRINNHRLYQPTFLMERYNLTYEEAMTILEHCNQQRWMEHGAGARSSWMTDEGNLWCKEHITADVGKLSTEFEELCSLEQSRVLQS